eukprot:Nk52_evm14s296 gene=Nk52_evmTU14s296
MSVPEILAKDFDFSEDSFGGVLDKVVGNILEDEKSEKNEKQCSLKRKKNTNAVRKCRQRQRQKLDTLEGFLERALRENALLKEKLILTCSAVRISTDVILGQRQLDVHTVPQMESMLLEAQSAVAASNVEQAVQEYKRGSSRAKKPVTHCFVEESKYYKPAKAANYADDQSLDQSFKAATADITNSFQPLTAPVTPSFVPNYDFTSEDNQNFDLVPSLF